jgi:hypothetical protein
MAARKTTSKTENSSLTGGPKTDAGKSTSAQNSRRHGLTAKNPLYTDDELAAIERLTKDLEATYQPKGPAETQFLRDIAVQFQRQKRLDAYVQLLADRVTTARAIGKLAPNYPLKYPFDFGGGDTAPDDEISHLNDLNANLPKTSDGWRDAIIAYSERYVAPVPQATKASPLVKTLVRYATGHATIPEVKQAIADRVAEVRDRQQQYQEERDRLDAVESAIAVYESQLNESIEKIQGSIRLQLKAAIGNLKELQLLRLAMATGAIAVNSGIAKSKKGG